MLLTVKSLMLLLQRLDIPSRPHVRAKPLGVTETSDVNCMVIRPLVAVRFSVPVPQLFHICVPLAMVPSHILR